MRCLPRDGRDRPRSAIHRHANDACPRSGRSAGRLPKRGRTIGPRLLVLALTLGAPSLAAWGAPVLRVGVLDGSPPCSEQRGPGRWQGTAVELWQFVAARERLAYTFEPYATARALLEASRQGQVDVGVGCLTITPERVGTYRFSLPFQESGLALLMAANRLATLRAVLTGLLDPRLLGLLAGYLVAIAMVSVAVWRLEGGIRRGTPWRARRRADGQRAIGGAALPWCFRCWPRDQAPTRS